MLFELIFGSLFIAAWMITGSIPWLALSVATRGRAGLANLPLCIFGGVVAGLAVPVLGLDGVVGIPVSFAAAVVVPALLLAARRFALGSAAGAGKRETSPPGPGAV